MTALRQRVTWTLVILFCIFNPTLTATAQFKYSTCCKYANREHALFSLNNASYSPFIDDYTACDQQYNASIPAAEDIYVTYNWCREQCPGFTLSKFNDPGSWAGPIVQFILPSLIFSMSIPRRTMFIPMFDIGTGWRRIPLGFLLSLVTALDTIVWVGVILMLSGPLMVSGLTEALYDYRILRAVSQERGIDLDTPTRLRLIVTVVCGNILLHPTRAGPPRRKCPLIVGTDDPPMPLEEIPDALERETSESQEATLLNLMSAQGDFGALVGAPVIFYIGGFIYTILDLLSDPSVQDSAISLAFGVEWMIIVHVAIISGCLLASNNPSAVSVLANRAPPARGMRGWTKHIQLPLVYETRFQPVTMWERGTNKYKWLEAVTEPPSTAPTPLAEALERVRSEVHIGGKDSVLWIYLPTVMLISLPPAAAAIVAYSTPPVGWACRSLTFVCYAGCQLLLLVSETLRYYLDRPGQRFTRLRMLEKKRMSVVRYAWYIAQSSLEWVWVPLANSIILCILSLFMSLGGTIAYVIGAYDNCFCYVTAGKWLNLDNAFVDVASDTYDQRHSSQNWIYMGVVATGFMAFCAYAGWWYQKKIREEYRLRVKELYE